MFVKILFFILYLILIAAFIYGLWGVVPHLFQLPWVPTKKERARRALEMAKLQPGEVFYDLGAGDGRILMLAVEEFGARAIGIEASPLQFALAWARCFFSDNRSNVRVRYENFYRADFSDADVVFAYLTPKHAIRMQDKLASMLKSGTRVVAIAFEFPDWKPYNVDEDELLFAYQMPAEAGGLTAYLLERAA